MEDRVLVSPEGSECGLAEVTAMIEERFSELFPDEPAPARQIAPAVPISPPPVLPLVTIESIYQSAAARASYDHELDKLFNPEFYGEHGDGI